MSLDAIVPSFPLLRAKFNSPAVGFRIDSAHTVAVDTAAAAEGSLPADKSAAAVSCFLQVRVSRGSPASAEVEAAGRAEGSCTGEENVGRAGCCNHSSCRWGREVAGRGQRRGERHFRSNRENEAGARGTPRRDAAAEDDQEPSRSLVSWDAVEQGLQDEARWRRKKGSSARRRAHLLICGSLGLLRTVLGLVVAPDRRRRTCRSCVLGLDIERANEENESER